MYTEYIYVHVYIRMALGQVFWAGSADKFRARTSGLGPGQTFSESGRPGQKSGWHRFGSSGPGQRPKVGRIF